MTRVVIQSGTEEETVLVCIEQLQPVRIGFEDYMKWVPLHWLKIKGSHVNWDFIQRIHMAVKGNLR